MSEEDRAARYKDLFEDAHDHAADCAYCPICATISVVRRTKPELIDHLSAAARELMIVAGILIEEASEAIGAEPKPRATGDPEVPRIRRIDIG